MKNQLRSAEFHTFAKISYSMEVMVWMMEMRAVVVEPHGRNADWSDIVCKYGGQIENRLLAISQRMITRLMQNFVG